MSKSTDQAVAEIRYAYHNLQVAHTNLAQARRDLQAAGWRATADAITDTMAQVGDEMDALERYAIGLGQDL